MGRRSRSRSHEDRFARKQQTTRVTRRNSDINEVSESPRRRKDDTERRSRKQVVEKHAEQSDDQNVNVVADPGDFSNFPNVTADSVKGLVARGITHLFPVQYMSFNQIYGRNDLIVRDLTGSGKTLGFALPMVEYLRKNRCFGTGKCQAMVLAPTRELALQVTKEFNLLKHHSKEYNVLTVYGGVSLDDQMYALRRGVDIFVGTTGRILDHMERKNFDFTQLKSIALDEADQMLKLGFKEDVDRILGTIKQESQTHVQTLLFSATVPSWVQNVARQYMSPNFQTIDLAKNLANKTSKTVSHLGINCPFHNRMNTLADILIIYGGVGQTIVFCSTKQEANSLLLSEKIKQDIEVMHGDIAQNQREVTLKRFKDKKFSVLVATDVASRGLDIPNVDLVIQVEPPKDTETYIHRSGRTARAGKSGTCITFFTMKQKQQIQFIEHKAGIKIQRIGIPQPEDVIKASSRDTIKNLKEVNDEVLDLFEEAADQLILDNDGDTKKALQKTLAFISGQYKAKLAGRSLLNGQEGATTFELRLNKQFFGVSLVWNILRKYVPDDMTREIKGMRCFADQTGAVFDVLESHAERFEDIFTHLKNESRIDFDIQRSMTLPDLKEDADGGMGGQGGHMGGGGYGGQRNSWGGNQGMRGGQQNGGGYGRQPQYGQRQQMGNGNGFDRYQTRQNDRQQYGVGGGQGGGRNQDNTVFVGGLGFDMNTQLLHDLLNKQFNLNPSSIRPLQDDQGKFKGAAFVEFGSTDEANAACKYDGYNHGSRRLRINPASNRPGGGR